MSIEFYGSLLDWDLQVHRTLWKIVYFSTLSDFFLSPQVLCAWDIFEHVLLQKITVKFLFSQRLPDHGPSILHILQLNNSLCVLCNEYIAEFKVGSAVVSVAGAGTTTALGGFVGGSNKQSVWNVTSHEHPLCAALYNAHFRQVSNS